MLLQQSARATSWSARFISARQSRKSTRPKTSCSTAQPLTHALPQRSRAALVTTGRPPYHSDDTAAPPPQGRMEAPPYVISRPSSLIHTKAAAAGSSSTGGGRRPGTATSTRPTSRVLLPAAGKTKGYAYAYKHHRTNNRSSTDINSACCCGVGEILCNHSNLPPAGAATCVPSFRLHHLSGGGRGGGGGGGIAAASSRAGISTAAAATQEAERASGGGSAVGGAVVRRGGEGGGDASSGDGASRLKSFRLTDIGEGIKEVEVLQWFVGTGDHVRQFDKLCEVQSDKANVEITSRYDGVIRKIHSSVGDMLQTGEVLVDIEEPAAAATGGSSPKEAVLSSAEEPSFSFSMPAPLPAGETPEKVVGAALNGSDRGGSPRRRVRKGEKVLAAPAVRRLCRELSIDLDAVGIVGTGSEGRVLKGDVLTYASVNRITAVPAGGVDTDSPAINDKFTALGDMPVSVETLGGGGDGGGGGAMRVVVKDSPRQAREQERSPLARKEESGLGGRQRKEPVAVPIRGVQRAMMEAMQRALEVPHMTFCDEVNADRLSLLRADLKEAADRRGVRLSYLPLIVKATSLALTAFPSLNASLSEDKSCLLQHPDHNIGVAMDTEKGLLVPSISAVQERSVLDIAEELNALQRLGAQGKLGEAELTGTTFTLSNIGSIGGTYASPVILHPQVCIGALGKMQRVPRFDPVDVDTVVAARVFPVSWSADHRVVDGGTIARFSNVWKAYLENPARMLADTR